VVNWVGVGESASHSIVAKLWLSFCTYILHCDHQSPNQWL